MSIATPGFGVPTATNPPDGRVGLEGALLAPTTVRRGLDPASDFAPQMVAVANAPADSRAGGGAAIGTADPLVAPPIYGSWHAAVERVNASGTGWADALNVHPRYRAAAGLGARVIRTHQERYMRLAWEQIGDVVREPRHSARTAREQGRGSDLREDAGTAIGRQSHGARRPDIRAHHGEFADLACDGERELPAARGADAGAEKAPAAARPAGAAPGAKWLAARHLVASHRWLE